MRRQRQEDENGVECAPNLPLHRVELFMNRVAVGLEDSAHPTPERDAYLSRRCAIMKSYKRWAAGSQWPDLACWMIESRFFPAEDGSVPEEIGGAPVVAVLSTVVIGERPRPLRGIAGRQRQWTRRERQ